MVVNDKKPILSPVGYHIARCIGIIQIGSIFIYEHWKQMMRIEFELPFQNYVFKEGEPERPKMVSKEYAASLYGKSHLKSHLVSWFGEEFVQNFAQSFDTSMILGQPGIIKISHKKTASGAWYEDIDEIHALREGYECPPQINKLRTLVLNPNEFDLNTFNELPDFLKKKIMGSQEYRKMFGEQEVHYQS